jgi:RNase P protein component
VDRNRLKRRLRELVRLDLLGPLRRSSPVDVAIRARPEAYTATVPNLRADVDVVRARLATEPSAE